MTTAAAPGKIILLGEHAVVYRRPALAVPLTNLTARASIQKHGDTGILIKAPDIDQEFWLHAANDDQPLAKAVRLTLAELQTPTDLSLVIQVESNLPIAAGLGSGAAISIAIIRALSQHVGKPLSAEKQAALAFEVEKLHHGTPSGIDNTVIAHQAPVYFLQGAPLETFQLGRPVHLLIGDTGITSPTASAVGGVRNRWQQAKSTYEAYFDEIGQIVKRARQALAVGNLNVLGRLMDENQVVLEKIGVSSQELETLITAARQAGALGAKLSGGGLGGNMIALVSADQADDVKHSLLEAGATSVIHAEVTG